MQIKHLAFPSEHIAHVTMEDAVFTDENKLVARRFVEEFRNQGRMEAVDELVAPGRSVWNQPIGPEGFKQFFTVVKGAVYRYG